MIALTFLLPANQAPAWEQIRCIAPINKGLAKHWHEAVYRPVLDPVSIPENSPQYQAALEAIERMNRNPSKFRYVFGGMDNGDGVSANNGESEIYMKDLGADSAKISAIEESDADYSPTCTATESDIIINTHYRMKRPPVDKNKLAFNYQKNHLFAYGGIDASAVSTIMHELGHSAGLQHEGDLLNLMGGNNLLVANGNVVEPYLGEDAASGLIALFGLAKNAEEDVTVSHWRYGNKLPARDGSMFSLHHRTRLFGANNEELSFACPYRHTDLDSLPVKDCPEPVYQVMEGQTVKLELTYENAGKTKDIEIIATYYLSSDNQIDETDSLLATRTYIIKRDNKPSTFNTHLKIPKNIVSDQSYWLGCQIKLKRNLLKEYNENNNVTYLGVKIN